MPFASVVLKSFLVVGRISRRLVNVYLSSPSLVLSTPFVDSHTLVPFRAGHFVCNPIHELVPFLHVPRDFVAYQTFVGINAPYESLEELETTSSSGSDDVEEEDEEEEQSDGEEEMEDEEQSVGEEEMEEEELSSDDGT